MSHRNLIRVALLTLRRALAWSSQANSVAQGSQWTLRFRTSAMLARWQAFTERTCSNTLAIGCLPLWMQSKKFSDVGQSLGRQAAAVNLGHQGLDLRLRLGVGVDLFHRFAGQPAGIDANLPALAFQQQFFRPADEWIVLPVESFKWTSNSRTTLKAKGMSFAGTLPSRKSRTFSRRTHRNLLLLGSASTIWPSLPANAQKAMSVW